MAQLLGSGSASYDNFIEQVLILADGEHVTSASFIMSSSNGAIGTLVHNQHNMRKNPHFVGDSVFDKDVTIAGSTTIKGALTLGTGSGKHHITGPVKLYQNLEVEQSIIAYNTFAVSGSTTISGSLKLRNTGAGSGISMPPGITLNVPLATISSSRFDNFAISSTPPGYIQTTFAGDDSYLLFELPTHLLTGTITRITAHCAGNGTDGHASVPATKPQITLFKISHDTGATAAVGSASIDASATTAAYNAKHVIKGFYSQAFGDMTATGSNDRFIVELRGESGAGAEASEFVVAGLTFTVND